MRPRAPRRHALVALVATGVAGVFVACGDSGFSVSSPDAALVALVDAGNETTEDAADPIVPEGGGPDAAPVDAGTRACPDGYSAYVDEGGKAHCYRLVSNKTLGVDPLTYSGARSACIGRGDHLVTTTTVDELRTVFVYVMATDNTVTSPWLGLRAPQATPKNSEGTYPKDAYRWVHESDAAIPNQWMGELTEQCVGLDMTASKFRTYDCNSLRAFICERDL